MQKNLLDKNILVSNPISNPKLPKHIAIVMDGNGRWAQQRNLPRGAGHEAGAKAVEAAIKVCIEKHIQVLTLFAFSSENWRRPAEEVNFLMDLFLQSLQDQTNSLHENNIQIRFMGDLSRFSSNLQQRINVTQELTAHNTGLKLVIAVNYSGRWDITHAMQQIAKQIVAKKLSPAAITEDIINQYLCITDLPEPDLLIRTSGEQRLSNFMLWQFAYTELYFCPIYWPDFDKVAFELALTDYANRQRRFGLTSEQLKQTCDEQNESYRATDPIEV